MPAAPPCLPPSPPSAVARSTTVCFSCLAAFPGHGSEESVALRAGLDDVCAVRQTIQYRLAQPCVGDLGRPFGKRQVGCHNYCRLSGAAGDHLEEQRSEEHTSELQS